MIIAKYSSELTRKWVVKDIIFVIVGSEVCLFKQKKIADTHFINEWYYNK